MKRLIVVGVISLVAVLAKADFLYWQIPEDAGKEFTVARLYAVSGDYTDVDMDSYTGDLANSGNPISQAMASGVNGTTEKTGTSTQITSVDVSPYESGYSFFVELLTYDGTNTTKDRLLAYSYQTLLDNGYIQPVGGVNPVSNPTNFSMTHVPEPSSGLLMLLGGALMALRRRRRA